MSQGRRSSFVVRVAEDRRGQVSGVIERMATGVKDEHVDGMLSHLLSFGQVFQRG